MLFLLLVIFFPFCVVIACYSKPWAFGAGFGGRHGFNLVPCVVLGVERYVYMSVLQLSFGKKRWS